MTFTQDLLYLLLLYAVLDKGNKLSLTTGLVIAFAILLFDCYRSRECGCRRRNLATATFAEANGII